MDLNELKLKDFEQLRSLLGKNVVKKRKKIENGGIRIVVLQRGWIVIGRYSQDGEDCTLTKAAVIRSWGTTKGLPELVNGPTNKTVLDKSDKPIHFHELTVVLNLECDECKWDKYLD